MVYLVGYLDFIGRKTCEKILRNQNALGVYTWNLVVDLVPMVIDLAWCWQALLYTLGTSLMSNTLMNNLGWFNNSLQRVKAREFYIWASVMKKLSVRCNILNYWWFVDKEWNPISENAVLVIDWSPVFLSTNNSDFIIQGFHWIKVQWRYEYNVMTGPTPTWCSLSACTFDHLHATMCIMLCTVIVCFI